MPRSGYFETLIFFSNFPNSFEINFEKNRSFLARRSTRGQNQSGYSPLYSAEAVKIDKKISSAQDNVQNQDVREWNPVRNVIILRVEIIIP